MLSDERFLGSMLCLSRLNVSIHANKQPMAHRVNNDGQGKDNWTFHT